jgi:cytidine deaminase
MMDVVLPVAMQGGFFIDNKRMKKATYNFDYTIYTSLEELNEEDTLLVKKAREITAQAYAPYSKFKVAAIAKLSNGKFVNGTNQENASYPAGICAERVLLSAVSSLYPDIAVDTIAISYHNLNGKSDHPISPCGICRQSLIEYEERTKKSIRLILSGMEGEIIVIEKAVQLMPISFGSSDLV